MPTCPDIDTLITLSRVDHDPVALIHHVASCDSCRDRVADAATVRHILASDTDLRPGFVDEVMKALQQVAAEGSSDITGDATTGVTDDAIGNLTGAEPSRPGATGGPAAWPWRVAGGGLAAATALAAVAASGGAAPIAPGPAVFLGAILAGLGGVAFSREAHRA